jgi:hypothetical protein
MPIEVDISTGDVQILSVPGPATTGKLLSGAAWLTGWSFRETGGLAVAALQITSGGNLVATIGLAAGASSNMSLVRPGIYMREDISIVVVSGLIEGAVYATWDKPSGEYP